MPALDCCAHCGAEVEGHGDSFAFGLSMGGILCASCRTGQPHVATLSGQTLDTIRVLNSPGNAWREPEFGSGALGSVRATLGAVISHHLGRRPKMLPYLGA